MSGWKLSDSEDEDGLEVTAVKTDRPGKVGTKKQRNEAEKGKPRGTGGGRAAGSSNSEEKKQIAEIFKENKGMFSTLLKQVLQLAQQNRDVMQVVFDVFLVPAEEPPAEKATRQNALIFKKIQKMGKGHGLCQPHVYTMAGILEGMEISYSKNEVKVKEVQDLIEMWKNMATEEKYDTVKFCRVVRCYDAAKKKVVLSWGPSTKGQEMRSVFIALLTGLPLVEAKHGRPPAGHLERELGAWLKALVGSA